MHIQSQRETFALRLAMADTAPWQSKIQHYPSPDGTGSYSVYDQGNQLGQLMYKRDQANPVIHIDHLWTDEDHQGNGIAQSMMERLHQDHPDHKINTGVTTDEGTGFTQRLLDSNPDYRSVLDNPEWFN
jgi:predicted GNAT family acetyltransferase